MDNFKNKVAVITGAASGIGRAIADRCAREGMRLVVADIEQTALDDAARELSAQGAEVLALRTDVSDLQSVQELADAVYGEFGAVHLLFNNAGVGTAGRVWENTISEWQWVLGVNLWGVIHGVHCFVPRMIAQDSECCVINTASIAGLITGPGMGVYNTSKHAVVALSETLYHDLAEAGTKVNVSVLCPAWVRTRIMDSARNRPHSDEPQQTPDALPPWVEARRQAIEGGLEPGFVSDRVFDAIRDRRFYIFTHPEAMPLVQARMAGILAGTEPINPVVAALKLTEAKPTVDSKQ